jgi:hypothetical protein
VDLVDAQPDPLVAAGVLLERLDHPVIGNAVTENKLEIGEVLRQDRFKASPDAVPTVSCGETDRSAGGSSLTRASNHGGRPHHPPGGQH